MERGTWSVDSPHVQMILAFIRKKKAVTAEMLVEFDAKHGKRLFSWDNKEAADEWRLHEARLFLNVFRMVKNGTRVRAFINMPANEAGGLEERSYLAVEDIADNPDLRTWVIQDVTKRAKMLASELRLWKLTREEQEGYFLAQREAMEPDREKMAA